MYCSKWDSNSILGWGEVPEDWTLGDLCDELWHHPGGPCRSGDADFSGTLDISSVASDPCTLFLFRISLSEIVNNGVVSTKYCSLGSKRFMLQIISLCRKKRYVTVWCLAKWLSTMFSYPQPFSLAYTCTDWWVKMENHSEKWLPTNIRSTGILLGGILCSFVCFSLTCKKRPLLL